MMIKEVFQGNFKRKEIKKRFPFLVMSSSKKNVIRGLHFQKKIHKVNLYLLLREKFLTYL